jgi:hypothetical protein
MEGKKKTSPPLLPQTEKKNWTLQQYMHSLLIVCMKLLFPKLFVTIFGLG